MSITGRKERYAHPATYTPDKSSCRYTASASAVIPACSRLTATAVSDQRATFSAAIARSDRYHQVVACEVGEGRVEVASG
jgi:hypothetical protein